jgi:glycosyltransferase involved in cell wall biosynthesis
MSHPSQIRQVAFIGNHLPRKCGLATFTHDLVAGLQKKHPKTDFWVLPMNDQPQGYDYPPPVRYQIREDSLKDYRRAADFLNINNVDAVCLQHEYGIYGGEYGRYILDLLDELRMPVITTLHTILKDPCKEQREILEELAKRSIRLVTMSQHGIDFLTNTYNIDPAKIAMIHHGIHDVPFVDPSYYKDQYDVEGRKLLLTFGLLSPGKGLEYAIKALPAIVEKHPEAIYMVVGATHPHVLAHAGESYRDSLKQLAQDLGVAEHLVFHDRFVETEELMQFIGAADIYLTPYLSEAQITSGTLAYALGAGKAVVSTPYWHAQELLNDDRGVLVGFKDPQAIAEAVIDLLDDDVKRNTMRKRAYQYGRNMVWSTVAKQYMELFETARNEYRNIKSIRKVQPLGKLNLPDVNLTHLQTLTDDTGIFQHAIYTVPDANHGYCIDDNARALLLCSTLTGHDPQVDPLLHRLASRYQSFIYYAWNSNNRRFRNFMSYDRRWLEEAGSPDSHARTLWALGTIMGSDHHLGDRPLSSMLFTQGMEVASGFTSARSWMFTILGTTAYLKRYRGDLKVRHLRDELAQRLMQMYQHNATSDWKWFEPLLTYSNARMAEALLISGYDAQNNQWADAGLAALKWLTKVQTGKGGIFQPIGSDGWYQRGGKRAMFDQQPIEAYTQVSATLTAWRLTGDSRWYDEATRAFGWFLGANDLGVEVYDPENGGCRDGLHADRLNENQGAESTLAYLLAQAEMIMASKELQCPSKTQAILV